MLRSHNSMLDRFINEGKRYARLTTRWPLRKGFPRTSHHVSSHRSTMLCEQCLAMFLTCEDGIHHPNLTSFTNAAANGCYICEPLLQYAIKKSSALENCMTEPYPYRVYWFEGARQAFLTVLLVENGKATATDIKFHAFPREAIPNPIFNVRNRNQAVSFEDATHIAQIWLNDCLTKHEQCRKHSQSSWYPTRLLKLGESTIKLISPAEESHLGPYVALSYCWGSNPQFLKLTASNLQQFRAGILYTDLPAAFQEAVQLIQYLSISYLWIDSLCIIQSGIGSAEDWRLEAARMQDIYSNCIINISLSQAANPTQSCFRENCLDAIPPFEIETRKIIRGNDNANSTHVIWYYGYYQYALYNQPLGYRAWALQEWFLAPRVLSFGLGEIFWDCPQLPNACETFPCGLGDVTDLFDIADRNIALTTDERTLETAWDRLVEEYTDRELTFPETDKLTALSAIATRIGDAMHDVYIAGHFWKGLPKSLAWYRKEPDPKDLFWSQRRRRKISPRAARRRRVPTAERHNRVPSWSWASMDGSLYWGDQMNHLLDCVADAEAYAMPPFDQASPEEQIVSASLKIRAYCAEVRKETGGYLICRAQLPDFHLQIHEFKFRLNITLDDPDHKPASGATFLIAAILTIYGGSVQGLVLQGTVIKNQKVYERIGFFDLSSLTMIDPNDFQAHSNADDTMSLFEAEKRTITLV